jgi:Holliday junction resolvase
MGDKTEREMVDRLESAGYAAMRAPASGSATERDLPDVIAGQMEPGSEGVLDYPVSRALVFEEKTSSGDPVYVEKGEADALLRFAQAFGAEPYIAVRWRSNSLRDTNIYVRHPHDCHTTEKYHRAKREDCVEDWRTLPQILHTNR